MLHRHQTTPLFPYTTLFRSDSHSLAPPPHPHGSSSLIGRSTFFLPNHSHACDRNAAGRARPLRRLRRNVRAGNFNDGVARTRRRIRTGEERFAVSKPTHTITARFCRPSHASLFRGATPRKTC